MPMSPRLLRPLASGFSLRQIAGLLDWWDASVSSSVVLNSGSVEEWRPVVGTRSLTQATPASRPGTGTVNGLGTVLFDGADDILSNTTLGSQTKTIVAVFAANSGGTQGILGEGDSSNTANRKLIHAGGGFVCFTRQSTTVGSVPIKSTETPQVAVASYETVESLRVDGATSGGTPSALNSSADGFVVGGRILFGTPATFYNGHVCEVATFDRLLTLAEIQKVEGYLAWKWGLQAQLPYDHPYAKSFPGFGSQTVPTDADTLTYLAAVKAADGTGVEVGVANAVHDFVKGCKADGIWDAIKASCILAGARTLAGALVPLVGSAPTNNNFVSGDYDRETGLVGDGSTKYLDSNRANDADPQDDNHNSLYISTAASTSPAVLMGSGAFADAGKNRFTWVTGDFSFDSRSGASIAAATMSITSPTGFVGHSRAASGTADYRIAGSTTAASQSAVAANANNVMVFARDGGNVPTNARLAFYSIGESLDLAALDNRVSTLITAIGAAI